MIIYANPAFYVFLATLTAFVLLLLTIFSTPLVSTFYFLHSSQANGVSFGMWGWCLDEGDLCSPIQFGYTWDPEFSIPITKALLLYPMTVIFVFMTMISMVPVLCARKARSADKVLEILAWISFGLSTLALLFMLGMWGTAKSRFESHGFSATYGMLPWMSLAATLLLLLVALSPYLLRQPPKRSSSRQTHSRSDIEARSRQTDSKSHSAKQVQKEARATNSR